MAEQIPAPKALNLNGNVAENWRRWRKAFELYMTATEKDKKLQKIQCATFLTLAGESAIAVWETLTFEETEKDKIEPLVAKFEEYCIPKKNITHERHMFNLRKQKPDESVEQFVTELKRLAKNCEYGELTDSIIKDRIVEGINNDSTRARLLREKSLSLERCIEVCKAAEVADEHMKTLTDQSGKDKEIDALKGKHYPRKNDERPRKYNGKQSTCGRCGRGNHGYDKCPAIGKECRKCHKKNHFMSQCRSRAKEPKDPRKPRIDSVETAGKQDGDGDSNDDELDEFFVYSMETTADASDPWIVPLEVNNNIMAFKIDTGSDVNVLSYEEFRTLKNKPKLKQSKTKLKAYNGGDVEVKGQCILSLKYKEKSVKALFIISPDNVKPILGRELSEKLNLVKRTFSVEQSNSRNKLNRSRYNTAKLCEKYADCFEGLGCLPNSVKIQLREDATPVVEPCRKIPFAQYDQLKEELRRMETMGVIKKIEEPTEWVHSFVPVTKPNGKLRVCLDPRNLNKSIKREHFKLPTRDEVTAQFTSAKVFTKLDASNGFWQMKLEEESTNLCTFNTPFGRYKYLRLPFGISSAPEIYHRTINSLFSHLEGVDTSMDDIIIYGSTPEEHDQRLEATMKVVREVGLKLQKEKCEVAVEELTFLGDTISAEGLKPDKRKVEAIQKMKRPETKADLQRFLGMINYLAKYVPDLSTRTLPLRKLLDQKVMWMWSHEQEKAWKDLKELVSSEPVLKFYDPTKPIKISTDASRSGLGAVLQQLHGETWFPVAYASRSVTDCESRYATIELETLGITFACERFHQYVYGQVFEIETDHKPLVSIFKKSLIDSPPRIQRLRLRLQRYDFKLTYVPGKWMHTPDALSRAPLTAETKLSNHIEAHIDGIVAVLQVTDEKLEQIKVETQKDETMILLQNTIMQGWPDERRSNPNELHPYWNIRDELTVHKGLILKGSKILIPPTMRKEILTKIHAGHQGREKCKQRARQVVFWPGINSDIDNLVESCETCQRHQHSHQKEPLNPYPVPTRPWQVISTDLCEINKKEYLIMVDAYSSYPEVIPLSRQSSEAVIKGMKVTFARHGIPDIVHSDNGPCYSSQEFSDFQNKWGFKHVTSSPHFPSSNGLAEKTVQTVKNIISKSMESGTDPYLGLLAYRTTPLGNNQSPAELLMGRTLKTELPVVQTQLEVKNSTAVVDWKVKQKEMQKKYHDRAVKPLPPLQKGERVRMYDTKKQEWSQKARVKAMVAPRSYIVETKDKVQYRRNRKHLRRMTSAGVVEDSIVTGSAKAEKESSDTIPSSGQSTTKSRYGRTIKKPQRFEQ